MDHGQLPPAISYASMQPWSQAVSQHAESARHTAKMVWKFGSMMHDMRSIMPVMHGLQPLVPLLVDMLLPEVHPVGQSAGQASQVSPVSHVPLPQTALHVQSAGHV